MHIIIHVYGTSLGVQWLGLYTFNAGAPGVIPGQGTWIPSQKRINQNTYSTQVYMERERGCDHEYGEKVNL